MTRFRTFLLLLLIGGVLFVSPTHGQSVSTVRPTRMAGLTFDVGIPTGEFADNLEDPGIGGSLFLGTQVGRSPVVLGLDVGFLIYGRSRSTVPFSTTVPIRVDLITTNSILQPHAVLRLQPVTGRVRPYVEAVGGFKYLSTETKVRDADRNSDDDRDIASETNFEDFAWSGGAGAGIDFVVYRPSKKQDAPMRSIALRLGTQYLFGQEAEYVAEGEIRDQNGNNVIDESELDIRRSATTLVMIKLGFTAYF